MDTCSHKIMPHMANNRFANHPTESLPTFIIPSCLMYLRKLFHNRTHYASHLSAWNGLNDHLSVENYHTHTVTPEIIWIGHASFLIKIGTFSILTDPVFYNLTPLFPRYQPPGIALSDIPATDVVLISHNHPDHLEKSTTIKLAKKYNPTFCVPQGDSTLLQRWGTLKIIEHMWWDTYTLTHEHDPHPLTLTFLPAYHWSGRWIFDTNKSLWGSWMISYNGYHCYFAGDTAYSHHFTSIAREFPNIHIALMPIAPCEPSEYLRKSHISSEEAGTAFMDLKAHNFVPMHWGTFGFGVDHPLDPLHRLESWWHKTMIDNPHDRTLIPLRIGQQLSFSNSAHSQQQHHIMQASSSPC